MPVPRRPFRLAIADNEAEPAARRSTAERVRVLLPLPLPAALDYRAPAGRAPPEPGSFVRVPLGGRSLDRRRLGRRRGAGEVAADRLKPVAEILPLPRAGADAAPLRRPRRRLHDGAAGCGAAHGDERRRSVAAAAAAPALRDFAGRARRTRRRQPGVLTPARRRVLETLRDGPPCRSGRSCAARRAAAPASSAISSQAG